MLLRVDIFPHNVPIEDGTPQSPLDPLHVSLSTSSSDDGTLVAVGRKDGDVIFNKDKSVSRQHLRLALVSKKSAHHNQIKEDDTVVAGAAAKPNSPEETRACDEDADGMCLVLSDLGSRFGTFIAVQRNSQDEKETEKVDDDETGDETEDEGDAASSGLALSSVASKLVDNPNTTILKRVKQDSTVVLSDLSTPGKSVVIQCGQNGSLIRVTRLPLNVVVSRVGNSVKKLWSSRLYALGASSKESLEDMTHLVTDNRDSVAKQLVAWSSSIPIVTPEYLQQLWDRKANDIMPDVTKYRAQGGNALFWDKISPNPRLWMNCTLLCLVPSEVVSLCRAGGAKVVSLEGLKAEEFRDKVEKVTGEESGCFFVDTTSRKVTKQVRELKERGVPYVTQRKVAACITNQEPLTDIEDKPIGPTVEEVAPDEHTTSETDHEAGRDEVKMAAVASQPDSGDATAVSAPTEQSLQVAPATGDAVDDSGPPEVHPEIEVTNASSQASTKSREKRSSTGQDKKQSLSEQENARPSKRSKVSRTDDAEQEELNEASDSTKSKRAEVDAPSSPEDPRSSKRKKLATSNDGWLVAAPSGTKRSSYRRSNDELAEALDGRKLITAETEKRSDLVVKLSKSNGSSQKLHPSSGPIGGVDYKKFRKNVVLRAANRTSRINLRSVLPKESEREHELELEQRQLDEEKRLADALFNDPGGGSMRKFFKPSRKKASTRRV